ncbi:tyrosine-type recombinase/integrase [Micromonospora sp. NPDC020750]|uniref:tyrosine-type recombinase/integrase n=1 Tax=unclassified Micromonospora TaxID=2617518 RepID=UPI00378D9175
MTDLVPVTTTHDRLTDLVAAFLRACGSPHTARSYGYGVTSWLDWCAHHRVDPLNAVPAHGQLWATELRDRGYSDGTRANRLSAVRSWYEWLDEQDVAFRKNPAKFKVGRPQANPVPTPALAAEQVVALLDAADADTPRTAAIVWTLATTGLRIAELLGADIEDLGQDQGHTVLHVMGKGRKRRSVPLIPTTHQRITTYLATRGDVDRLPALAAGARPRRALLVTDTGGRVDPRNLRRQLVRLATTAGLPEPLIARMGPHVLRATFVTLNLAAGKDLRVVQYAVGHATPTTTEGYDRSHLAPDSHPAYSLMGVLAAARARRTTEPLDQ